ncbi:MAG: hypothetical protein KJ622_15890 [Alphaproteobacteria bacterium]|nr:hypothetical protein [Alphaproteobacteria bacterium]
MNLSRIATLCIVALLAVSPAAAFEEQQGAAAAGSTQAPAPGIVIDNSKPVTSGGDVNFSTQVPANEAGAKVFLPGLGSLGMLPKLDFGLELLYGAAETPDQEPQANDLVPGDEDLMIKGRVKHRF